MALVTGALSAAFALCYTVSQVQFVLLMKLMPKLAGFDAPAEAKKFEASMSAGNSAPLPGTVEAGDVVDTSIAIRSYRVSRETIGGHTIEQIRAKAPRISIEMVRRGERWITPDDKMKLEAGDEVVVAAPLTAQVKVREALGPEIPDTEARARIPVHTVDVVVGKKSAAGKTLPALLASLGPGLYANALFRAGAELPVDGGTPLKLGDTIRLTGAESKIDVLGDEVGQVIRASHVNDVLTLALGLLVGAALGAIPVPVFGVRISFGAAAVLVTGIIFGWLKTRHPALGGPISEGGRSLLEVLGLNTFTAVLALNSGLAVYQVMQDGPIWSLILKLPDHQRSAGADRLVGGASPAEDEPVAADGGDCRCTTEHVVDAGGAGDVRIGSAGDRVSGAAGDNDGRAERGCVFLCAVRVRSWADRRTGG